MRGVSKITSQQDIMLATFSGVTARAGGPAALLRRFAEASIVVDMICQSTPRGGNVDFSFTTDYRNLALVMRVVASLKCQTPPLVSSGYVKINLFGADMVTSCGVGAQALSALQQENVEVVLITTSDLDISLLLQQQDEDVALKILSDAFGL